MNSRKVGRWRINFRQLQFEHIASGYAIRFSECSTSDETLGVIFHTHKKRVDDQDTFDLVEAMERALNPEETLWNRPHDHSVNWTRELVEKNYSSWEYNQRRKAEDSRRVKEWERKHPEQLH